MDSDTFKEMKQCGAPQHLIDELKQAQVIEILPLNWPIVAWWCEVSDLMRYHPQGACLGLDLTQVKTESELSQRHYSVEQFNGLRIMSRAAVNALNS